MTQRGVFFAINDETLKKLKGTKGDPKRRDFIEDLEENIMSEFSQDTDKAWYILFVMLYASKPSSLCKNISKNELKLLSNIFIGPKMLHKAELYIINWINKAEVKNYLELLDKIDSQCLQERYKNLNTRWLHEGEYKNDQKQFEYVLYWYNHIKKFFKRINKKELHILFTCSRH